MARQPESDRRLIVYELNEVPWAVVDSYVAERPQSNLASLLSHGTSLTTVLHNETAGLQPWRTWPSFHTSQLANDHNSYDLGQDPDTFRGTTMWDAAAAAGRKVGIFAPMQSWPARTFPAGGFWIPDTFARNEECVPSSINRFQAFNLAATKENGFSPDSTLRPTMLAKVGYDLVRRGLTPRSALALTRGVLRERRDSRYKAGRSIMQVIPCFDLYWRLHRTTTPDLSIFFTNHVAGMMHRYWGDAMEGYDKVESDYQPDPIFATMITRAMDVADSQFARIRRYVDAHPGTVFLIAGSMGQTAVPLSYGADQLVLDEPERLFGALALGQVEMGLAMYPSISLQLPESADAPAVAAAVQSIATASGASVFSSFRQTGRTVQFTIPLDTGVTSATDTVTLTPLGSTTSQTARLEDLGIAVRQRMGGSNTGYHVPEGIAVAYGAGIDVDPSRRAVDLLDMAPSLLANLLGVDPPQSMRGHPTLFGPAAGTTATTQPNKALA
jgi:hypothetical protein